MPVELKMSGCLTSSHCGNENAFLSQMDISDPSCRPVSKSTKQQFVCRDLALPQNADPVHPPFCNIVTSFNYKQQLWTISIWWHSNGKQWHLPKHWQIGAAKMGSIFFILQIKFVFFFQALRAIQMKLKKKRKDN